MKKFIIGILVFLGLYSLILLPPGIILYTSHEYFRSIKQVLKSGTKFLIAYRYNEHNLHYIKVTSITELPKREVWVVGSSRTLGFRDSMFSKPFYNAGYTIHDVRLFYSFLKAIPKEKYPRYLLMCIDQFHYRKCENSKTMNPAKFKNLKDFQADEKLLPGFEPFFGTYNEVIFEKDNLFKLFNNKFQNHYGLNAILTNSGFRQDGSVNYFSTINKLEAQDADIIKLKFDGDNTRYAFSDDFVYGPSDSVDWKPVAILDSFLNFCVSNNMRIVGYLPPFTNYMMHKINTDGKHAYFMHVYENLIPVFKKYNFELYDFTDQKTLDATDSEFMDGYHPFEITYHKMLLYMLRHQSVLNEVADSSFLKEKLINTKSKYVVFHE